MPWPFVLRARLDLAKHNLEEMRSLHHAERARWDRDRDALIAEANAGVKAVTEYWQSRYDTLLSHYHGLRIVGAWEPAAAVSALPPPAAKPADEMKALIDAVCGADYQKRAMMLRQLTVDRAAHIPDEDIRSNILNGVPTDGVPA